MALDGNAFFSGVTSAAAGYGAMLSARQKRELLAAENKRAEDRNEREQAVEGRAAENNEYNKTLRARDEAIRDAQEERAAAAEKREAAAAGRLADTFAYNQSQRPVTERRAEAAEQRLVNQDKRYQQTSDIQATKEEERTQKEFNKALIGELASTKSYGIGTPGQVDDPIALAEERPDLIIGALNRHKNYQFAVIDGEKVEIDIIGLTVTDNAVIPRIANAETGEELTPTIGGTNKDADPVLMQTHAQFSRLVNNEVASALNNGGSEASVYQSELVKFGGMTATRAQRAEEQAMRDEVFQKNIDKYGQSAEATRAYMGVLNEASYDEVAEQYVSQGGDIEKLRATLKEQDAAATAAAKEAEDSKKMQIVRSSEETAAELAAGGTALRAAELGLDLKSYPLYEGIREATDKLRSAGGISGIFDDQSGKSYKTNTAAEKWYDTNSPDLAKQMLKNPAIKTKFDSLGPVKFFQQYGVDTAGGQVEPKNMLASIQPPPFPLTKENIIAAITDQSKRPTKEQRDDMVQFLVDNDVVTDAKFRAGIESSKLPPEEAAAAIWTAVAYGPGTPAERTAEGQRLINLARRGDTKVGVEAQDRIDSRAQTREDNLQMARNKIYADKKAAEVTREQELTDEQRALDREELKTAQKYVDGVSERYFTTVEAGPPSAKQAKKIVTQLRPVMQKLKRAQGPDAKQEILGAVNMMMSSALQGYAVKDGFFANLTTNDDVDDGQKTDFNANFIMLGPDQTLVYAPPGGQAGTEVELEDLQEVDASFAALLKLTAELNSATPNAEK